jgi:hypothetical protein
MQFIHKNCGGKVENKVCTKCHKRWNYFTYLFGTDLRLVSGLASLPKSLASKEAFASALPQWPRRTRILVSVAVVALLAIVIVVIRLLGD